MADIDTALGLAEHHLEMLKDRREVILILIAETEIEIKGIQMAIGREAARTDASEEHQ